MKQYHITYQKQEIPILLAGVTLIAISMEYALKHFRTKYPNINPLTISEHEIYQN